MYNYRMPPRCPRGSRRNKKTGLCQSVKRSPTVSPISPPTASSTSSRSSRFRRCPRGSRRNRKTGKCVRHTSRPTEPRGPLSARAPPSSHTKLSAKEIDNVIRQCGAMSESEEKDVRESLARLTKEKGYVSCFGERPVSLFEQAVQKVQCFTKYGDPIV